MQAVHRVGDLVWGKQQGFSWWPCIVTYDPDHGQFMKTDTGKKSAAKTAAKEAVHVQFLGHERPSRAWLNCSALQPWEDTKEEHLKQKIKDRFLPDWRRALQDCAETRGLGRPQRIGRHATVFGRAEEDDERRELIETARPAPPMPQAGRAKWTKGMDAKLMKLVLLYGGSRQWNDIARQMGYGLGVKQIQNRWRGLKKVCGNRPLEKKIREYSPAALAEGIDLEAIQIAAAPAAKSQTQECQICKRSTGTMLACVGDCGYCFHRECIGLARTPRAFQCDLCYLNEASTDGLLSASDDDDGELCVVCSSGADSARMLLCDGCDDGYHLDCLEPKMGSIPRGSWFCPSCSQARKGSDACNGSQGVDTGGGAAEQEIDGSKYDGKSAAAKRVRTPRFPAGSSGCGSKKRKTGPSDNASKLAARSQDDAAHAAEVECIAALNQSIAGYAETVSSGTSRSRRASTAASTKATDFLRVAQVVQDEMDQNESGHQANADDEHIDATDNLRTECVYKADPCAKKGIWCSHDLRQCQMCRLGIGWCKRRGLLGHLERPNEDLQLETAARSPSRMAPASPAPGLASPAPGLTEAVPSASLPARESRVSCREKRIQQGKLLARGWTTQQILLQWSAGMESLDTVDQLAKTLSGRWARGCKNGAGKQLNTSTSHVRKNKEPAEDQHHTETTSHAPQQAVKIGSQFQRVSLWSTKTGKRLNWQNCPTREGLEAFLTKYPYYVLYTGQDQPTSEVTRVNTSAGLRRPWTDEEERVLFEMFDNDESRNWDELAAKLGTGRSIKAIKSRHALYLKLKRDNQCDLPKSTSVKLGNSPVQEENASTQQCKPVQARSVSGAWTEADDEALIAMIKRDGVSSGRAQWSKMAERLGLGRSGASIETRWHRYLRPKVRGDIELPPSKVNRQDTAGSSIPCGEGGASSRTATAPSTTREPSNGGTSTRGLSNDWMHADNGSAAATAAKKQDGLSGEASGLPQSASTTTPASSSTSSDMLLIDTLSEDTKAATANTATKDLSTGEGTSHSQSRPAATNLLQATSDSSAEAQFGEKAVSKESSSTDIGTEDGVAVAGASTHVQSIEAGCTVATQEESAKQQYDLDRTTRKPDLESFPNDQQHISSAPTDEAADNSTDGGAAAEMLLPNLGNAEIDTTRNSVAPVPSSPQNRAVVATSTNESEEVSQSACCPSSGAAKRAMTPPLETPLIGKPGVSASAASVECIEQLDGAAADQRSKDESCGNTLTKRIEDHNLSSQQLGDLCTEGRVSPSDAALPPAIAEISVVSRTSDKLGHGSNSKLRYAVGQRLSMRFQHTDGNQGWYPGTIAKVHADKAGSGSFDIIFDDGGVESNVCDTDPDLVIEWPTDVDHVDAETNVKVQKCKIASKPDKELAVVTQKRKRSSLEASKLAFPPVGTQVRVKHAEDNTDSLRRSQSRSTAQRWGGKIGVVVGADHGFVRVMFPQESQEQSDVSESNSSDAVAEKPPKAQRQRRLQHETTSLTAAIRMHCLEMLPSELGLGQQQPTPSQNICDQPVSNAIHSSANLSGTAPSSFGCHMGPSEQRFSGSSASGATTDSGEQQCVRDRRLSRKLVECLESM